VLADLTDLKALRPVAEADEPLASAMLAAASAAIVEAAGSPIVKKTSTVKLVTVPGRRLRLPGGPIREVLSVKIDGDDVDGWVLRGDSLWRRTHWQTSAIPVEVEVTYTHGYDEVPEDIVYLTCLLASSAMAEAGEGLESRAGLAYESIDDYRVGFEQGQFASTSAIEIPAGTRAMLRRRFGNAVGMTVTRS